MAENTIPFQTMLEDDGLTVGIDQIVSSLDRLETLTTGVADTLSTAFTKIEEGFSSAGAAVSDAATVIASGFSSAVDAVSRGSADLVTRLGELVRAAGDASSQLGTLVTSSGDAGTSFADLAASATASAETLTRMDASLAGVVASSTEAADAAQRSAASLANIEAASTSAAASLDALTGQMKGLLDNTSVAAQVLTRISSTLNDIRSAARGTATGIGDLVVQMRDLVSFAQSMDAQLFDAVNALGDIKVAAESTASILGDLSLKMDQLITTTADLGAAGTRGAAGLQELERGGLFANKGIMDLTGGIGDFVVMMGGFTILNDAMRGLQQFGDAAIYGNARVERLQATLEALLGSKGAAQQIVDWSYAFGRSIPDTTTNLQQAIVTIASLGINVQQFMPSLATMAGIMGETLPIAAQAFLDAFASDRFLMMQRRLRITKDELEQFGLQVDKNGKIIQSTLVPAFEKLVAAKFPQGLTEIMQTFSGETSNIIDQLQQLGQAFGKPIFDVFRTALFAIIQYVNANHDAIWNFATAVGGVLGGALQGVLPLIGDFVQYLQNNKAALIMVGGAILGLIGGAFVAIIVAIGGLVGGFAAFVAICMAVGAAVAGLVGPIVAAVVNSAPLRQAFHDLWDAATNLASAILGPLLGAFDTLKSPLDHLSGGLDHLFGYFVQVDKPMAFGRAAHGMAGGMSDAAKQARLFGQDLEYVRGPLSGVVDAIRTFARWVGGVAHAIKDGNFTGLGKVVTDVATAFAAIGGPALLVSGIFSKFGLTVGSVFGFLKTLAGLGPTIMAGFDKFFFGFLNFVDTGGGIASTFRGIAGGIVGLARAGAALVTTGGWIPALQGLAGSLGGSLAGLAAAAAPVVAVVAAIALVVGGVVFAFMHWWTTNEGFRKGLMGMLGEVAGLGKVLLNSLKPAWDQIQKSIQDLKPTWDLLVRTFQQLQPLLLLIGGIIIGVLVVAFGILFAVLKGVIMALGPLLAGAIQAITGVIQIIVGVISLVVHIVMGVFAILKDIFTGDTKDLGKDAATLWKGIVDSVGQIFGGIVNVVMGILGGLWKGIVGLVTGIVTGVIDWFKHLADMLVGHSIIPDMINAILAAIAGFVTHFVEWIINLATMVMAAVLTLRDRFLQFIDDLVMGTITKIEDMALKVLENINTFVNMILALALSWRDKFLAFIEEMVIGTIDKLGNMAIRAIDHIGMMITEIILHVVVWKDRIIALVQALVAQFLAHLAKWITDGVQKAKDFIAQIGGEIASWPGKMAHWALDMVNAFINQFSQLAGKALKIAQDTAANIAGLLHHSSPDTGPLAGDDKWMPDMVDSLSRGFEDNTPKLVNAASAAASAMRNVLGNINAGGEVSAAQSAQAGNIVPAAAARGGTGIPLPAAANGAGRQVLVVNMPDGFASGFGVIDPAIRKQLVMEIRDEMSKQQARGSELQGIYANGYSGYSAG